MTSLSSRELDIAVAAPMRGGHLSACSVLRALLRGRSRTRPASVTYGQALLLAAVTRNFLLGFWQDLDAAPTEVGPVAQAPSLSGRRAVGHAPSAINLEIRSVRGRQIGLPSAHGLRQPCLLRTTYQLLETLPSGLERSMVAWAPPVLLQDRRRPENYSVAGNLVSALIAHSLLPDTVVRVRVVSSGQRRRDFQAVPWLEVRALAVRLVGPLDDLCRVHRLRIIELAGEMSMVRWLTLRERSMAYLGLQRLQASRDP